MILPHGDEAGGPFEPGELQSLSWPYNICPDDVSNCRPSKTPFHSTYSGTDRWEIVSDPLCRCLTGSDLYGFVWFCVVLCGFVWFCVGRLDLKGSLSLL